MKNPVIVPDDFSSDVANETYGESYGVDWMYAEKKSKLESRKSKREERFLKDFGIEWHDAFGYFVPTDEESGKMVSPEKVNHILKIRALMNRETTKICGVDYWSDKQVVDLLKLAMSMT